MTASHNDDDHGDGSNKAKKDNRTPAQKAFDKVQGQRVSSYM